MENTHYKIIFYDYLLSFSTLHLLTNKRSMQTTNKNHKDGFYSRSLIFRLQSKKIFWFWFHFPIEKGTRGLLFRFIISLFNSLKFELSLIRKKKKKRVSRLLFLLTGYLPWEISILILFAFLMKTLNSFIFLILWEDSQLLVHSCTWSESSDSNRDTCLSDT